MYEDMKTSGILGHVKSGMVELAARFEELEARAQKFTGPCDAPLAKLMDYCEELQTQNRRLADENEQLRADLGMLPENPEGKAMRALKAFWIVKWGNQKDRTDYLRENGWVQRSGDQMFIWTGADGVQMTLPFALAAQVKKDTDFFRAKVPA